MKSNYLNAINIWTSICNQTMIDGVVIRAYPYGEADLVLRILSPTEGKLSLLARHSRKSRRRFSSSFDLFDRGTFEIRRGNGSLATVTSFSSHPYLAALRSDLDRCTLGMLLCECVDLLTHEGMSETELIYEAFNLGLEGLSEAGSLKEGLRAVFLALAGLLKVSGLLELAAEPGPSLKNLLKLLDRIEQAAEKRLSCREATTQLLHRLDAET